MDAVDGHVVGQGGGADQEGAVLDHLLERVLRGQRPVLNAVHPGPDAGADAGVAVRVGRDAEAIAMCLVHYGGSSSSSEYCWQPAAELNDITPPEAEILMSLAPYLI